MRSSRKIDEAVLVIKIGDMKEREKIQFSYKTSVEKIGKVVAKFSTKKSKILIPILVSNDMTVLYKIDYSTLKKKNYATPKAILRKVKKNISVSSFLKARSLIKP